MITVPRLLLRVGASSVLLMLSLLGGALPIGTVDGHSLIGAVFAIGTAAAATDIAKVEQDAAIDQRLGHRIDLALPVTDEQGAIKSLRDFVVPGRPAIIVPVYFTCPRRCTLTQTGVADLINGLKLSLGKDYSVLSVSFREGDGVADAAKKAAEFRAKLKQRDGAPGWHFLTGESAPVKELMAQLGFHFAPDGEDISHAATIILISPDGMVTRYFFGIEFPLRDVRYALVEAAAGKIGTLADHIFLFCFRFDPTKGKYTLVIWNITRAFCGLVVVLLAAMLITLRIRENGNEHL